MPAPGRSRGSRCLEPREPASRSAHRRAAPSGGVRPPVTGDDGRRGEPPGAAPAPQSGRVMRRTAFTARAAVLALVVAALAFTLAYPARQFYRQRQQIA